MDRVEDFRPLPPTHPFAQAGPVPRAAVDAYLARLARWLVAHSYLGCGTTTCGTTTALVTWLEVPDSAAWACAVAQALAGE
jgi:hypothetical protein